MKEEELYSFLYTINCNKELYDRKIGVLFHDIYVHKADYSRKVICIKMQDGRKFGLTPDGLEILLNKSCGLQIRNKRTKIVNEILTKELSAFMKQHFCDRDENVPLVQSALLDNLLAKSTECINKHSVDEKQYRKDADVLFFKERDRSVIASDGFEVRYKVFGGDNFRTMVLLNAYGMPAEIWKYIIYYYSREYKVIICETRGTLAEHVNINLQPIVFSKDLECVLEKESILEVMLVCWCSGLKVLAEFYKRNPDRISAIVIIAGYFNPFPVTESYWSDFDKSIGKVSQMIVKDNSISRNPMILGLIRKLFQFEIGEKRLENLFPNVSEYERYDIQNTLVKNVVPEVKELITLPFKNSQTLQNYAEITVELQKHEILSILAEIAVPTLIINAGKDMVTDIRCAKVGQTYIHDSKLVEIPDATHWCIWENYKEVVSIIDQFIAEL